MKLSLFGNSIKADVDDFISDWVEHNVKSPCEWPFDMNDSEWLDHFIFFLEEKYGKKASLHSKQPD